MLFKLNMLIRLALFWLFNAIYIIGIALFSALTFRKFLSHTIVPLSRFWSIVSLKLMDLKIEIEGLENIKKQKRGVFIFNHTSTLDIFVCTYCMPKRSMAIAKREIMYIPFINMAWWSFGFAFLKRGKGIESRNIFNKYTEKVFARDGILVAAPEGTRSKDGKVLPFKMGSFYAAMNAKVPVQFLIIYNAHDIWPVKNWFPKTGSTIYAKIMAPISTETWTEDNVDAKVAEIRADVIREMDQFRQKSTYLSQAIAQPTMLRAEQGSQVFT